MIKISIPRGGAHTKATSVLKISRELLMRILEDKPRTKANSLPPKKALKKLPDILKTFNIKYKSLKLVLFFIFIEK